MNGLHGVFSALEELKRRTIEGCQKRRPKTSEKFERTNNCVATISATVIEAKSKASSTGKFLMCPSFK